MQTKQKRSFRHWNLTYLVNRTLLALNEYKYPDHPWLVIEANQYIDNYLTDKSLCLEWGSGRSTKWYAQKVQHITSVEHQPDWFKKAQEMTKDYENVSLYLRSLENEEEYVGVADKFGEKSLDYCLVDGRLRAQCAMAVKEKIKSGGILVVDNIDRYIPTQYATPNQRSDYADPLWESFHNDVVGDWSELMYSNGIWSTAIWIKP